MARNGPADDWLFTATWVHVFEEDTPQGAVFRPDDADIPLSRRPRERIALHENGSARLFMPGPDDRFVEQPAEWAIENDELVMRSKAGSPDVRIVQRSPDRLLVKIRGTPPRR